MTYEAKVREFAEDDVTFLDDMCDEWLPFGHWLAYMNDMIKDIIGKENLAGYYEELEALFDDRDHGDEARDLWDRLLALENGGGYAVLQQ